MSDTVESFKKEWREKALRSPDSFFSAEQLKGVDPSTIKVEFADDGAIEDHLSGKPRVQGGICCLVTMEIPFVGGKICSVPPGGDPDNLCVR
ncbi:hypothetical protein [Cupriavidus alkaliphilus]|uniref:hypothetical protein n=1 Tax=Cupriavidus alkaliphilus TaxID=942866 RepID=UPI0010583433|nr:hypothetical protein [Cupriavidus alkaliphilus]